MGSFMAYNEKLFKFSETNEILKKVPKRVNIIIADEDLLIKVYKKIKIAFFDSNY